MNTMINEAAAPPLPSKATAAAGNTKPAETSSALNRLGYVGNTGFPSNASAQRPMVVAAKKGTANHANPPMM